MKHNFKFLSALIKLRLSHIMTFRLGFFGPLLINSSYFLEQIFAFEAIYGHVTHIRGWGRGEILIFIGTFCLVDAINMTICFFGVISIPEKIQTGELDLYLTKPVNPLLRITFEKVDPGSLPLLIRCFAFFIFSVNNLMKIENTVIDLCLKIPGIAFSGVSKIIFYCVLPYGMIATLPTQILIGALSIKGLLFGMVMVDVFTFFAISFWNYGVRRYESASS